MEESHAFDGVQDSAASAESKSQGKSFPSGKNEGVANASSDSGKPQVDPGALVLAAVAAAAAVILAEGAWDPLDSVVGAILLAVFLAHHRPLGGPSTARLLLLRGVFGGTVAIALGILCAWPFQDLFVKHLSLEFFWPDEGGESGADTDKTPWPIALVWFVVALIIAGCEPRISVFLDKDFKFTSKKFVRLFQKPR